MKAPIRWINDFVEIELSADILAERLTMAGIECTASREGLLDKIVVGEVLDLHHHPHTDHLSLCHVTDGRETFSIVCGAPNVARGQHVPLALPGAVLPDGMMIESSEIRGIRSEGMICSEKELDVGEDASGIWILPGNSTLGQRVDEAMGLEDWVLEFDLTPNRGDCLSIIGIAQEISALAERPLQPSQFDLEEVVPSIKDRFSISIMAPDLCRRYVAKLICGVTIKPSPLWMRRRLQLVGQRPINNVVDVTNYVMWELGQPLHAFDLSFLEEAEIVVKRAKEGEPFISLDGETRYLSEDMLMIWDGRKPVAVAGVMGGLNSEVTDKTEEVLIESAYFDPISIRKTAKSLGMFTEASRRFEKGVDPNGCLKAAQRAAYLMKITGGGQIAMGFLDEYPTPVHPFEKDLRVPVAIPLRVRMANDFLGTELDPGKIKALFLRLGMEVRDESNEALIVTPPTRRVDLTREVDLTEEIARIIGYDEIPTTLPRSSSISEKRNRFKYFEDCIKEGFLTGGFNEVITYSFISPASLDHLCLSAEDFRRNAIRLLNPLREDQSIMRTTLLPGLLETMRWNLSRNNHDIKAFEIGKVYLKKDSNSELPEEFKRMGALSTGSRYEPQWNLKGEEIDFYDMKGCLENAFYRAGIHGIRFQPTEEVPFLYPGRGCYIRNESLILGYLGELHPKVLSRYDSYERCYVTEIDLDLLSKLLRPRYFNPIPRYPEVVRDLSIIVDKRILSEEIREEIEKMEFEILTQVSLFDMWVGKQVPEGKRSLGFKIRYQAMDRSLTDQEVNQIHEEIIKRLEARFDANLR